MSFAFMLSNESNCNNSGALCIFSNKRISKRSPCIESLLCKCREKSETEANSLMRMLVPAAYNQRNLKSDNYTVRILQKYNSLPYNPKSLEYPSWKNWSISGSNSILGDIVCKKLAMWRAWGMKSMHPIERRRNLPIEYFLCRMRILHLRRLSWIKV